MTAKRDDQDTITTVKYDDKQGLGTKQELYRVGALHNLEQACIFFWFPFKVQVELRRPVTSALTLLAK